MKKRIAGLLLVIACTTTAVRAQKNADAFKWLHGTWKINAGNGFIVESWKAESDSSLLGKSYFVKAKGDTIPQETLKIVRRGTDWYYVTTVQGQNGNQPVAFKMVFQKGTEFISLNPEHDFPQRIAYRRIDKRIHASIEGQNNGRYGKQNFDFTLE